MSDSALPETLVTGPKRSPKATLLLAHGAGAPMDSDFMNSIAAGLADAKIQVVRFEFPYMHQQRITGKKRPPNGARILIDCFENLVRGCKKQNLVVGGKSMGGRIASMIADQTKVSAVVCLGYPFHPPGKPNQLRTEHLEKMKTPTLILQGERDPFGKPSEIKSYSLSKKIKVEYVKDGDHSFKPRKASGVTYEENLSNSVQSIEAFLGKVLG